MTKYEDLIRGLKQGRVLPLYLFFGEEEFLVQEAVDLVARTVVEPGNKDFNTTVLYCRGTTGAELVNLCQTLPFMADKRLVVAKEIEALKAADLDAVLAYLRDPSPSTCLVMVAGQPRFDKKSVLDAVEAAGAVTRFYALQERDAASWIDRWARSRGLSLQGDAVHYVLQTLGNDLQTISNELEKTVIAVGRRTTITYDDVKAVVGDFREYTPFDLADALGRKDREGAFRILHRLLEEGEQPVALLGSVAWTFRRLARAKGMESVGIGFEEIKKRLRIIFHQSRAFQVQMKSFTLQELERVFTRLLDADRALKSGVMSGRIVLERMVLELCGR